MELALSLKHANNREGDRVNGLIGTFAIDVKLDEWNCDVGGRTF